MRTRPVGSTVGAVVLTNVLDRPNAVPVWVVSLVGAHFWPFAHAFVLLALAAAGSRLTREARG